MKKFIPYFTLFLIVFMSCKNVKTEEQLIEKETTKKLIFPNDFFGIYKGKITIDNAKGKQEIDMEYHFLETDTVGKYGYKLIYNGSPRNYFLIEKDVEKGLYEVDENNGIFLPTYLNDNTLHSFFEVQGNLLSTRTRFFKNKLHFEILFTAFKNKKKTGGTSKEIPEVFSFPITTFQKAVLKKQY